MSSDLSLSEVERLISALGSRVRSEKTRAAAALARAQVYPRLIPDIDEFFAKVLRPVAAGVASDTERVREHCMQCVAAFLRQIGDERLSDTIALVLPPLIERLRPGAEPAEHLQRVAIDAIRALVALVTPASTPQSCDGFVVQMVQALKSGLESGDAEMKKASCSLLNELMSKTTRKAALPLGGLLMRSVLVNCTHRHNEVRKVALGTLCNLVIVTGYYDDIESIDAALQKLVNDRNSGVRKEVINFCREMLVKHPMKHVVYFPLVVPLLYFVAPLVPKRKVLNEISVENDVQTDEALMSYNAIVEIGNVYEKNNDVMDLEFCNEMFDESGRKVPKGFIRITQKIFSNLMNYLIPMISDWTETKRIIGYESLRALLHISYGYEVKFVPQIIHEILISLHDFKEETEMILQIVSIMAANVPSKEIIDILVPKIINNCKKEIILVLATTIINGKLDIDELNKVLNAIISVESYLIEENIDFLTQLILSMISKDEDFVQANIIQLLRITLSICEKTDSLNIFKKYYQKPISEIIDNNFQKLIDLNNLTPSILEIILNNSSQKEILSNQDKIISLLLKFYDNFPNKTSQIIQYLSLKKSLKGLNDEFIQKTTNPESINMVKCLVENDSYEKNSLVSNIDLIFNIISESIKSKQTIERQTAFETIKILSQNIKFNEKQFKLIYNELLEGLKDHCNEIRILSLSIFETLLIEYQSLECIEDNFNEICLTIDDENELIRKSTSSLLQKLCSVEKWKEIIISILKHQQNYHKEAEKECNIIISIYSK